MYVYRIYYKNIKLQSKFFDQKYKISQINFRLLLVIRLFTVAFGYLDVLNIYIGILCKNLKFWLNGQITLEKKNVTL
jgi:hypothetical protein